MLLGKRSDPAGDNLSGSLKSKPVVSEYTLNPMQALWNESSMPS